MKIKIREKEKTAILDLEGNIGIDSSDLVEAVGWALVNRSKSIILNFEGVNLIDYVGVSLLAVIYKNVLNHKGTLLIYAVPAHVLKLFSIVGLNRVFEYYTCEEEALAALRKPKPVTQDDSQEPLRRKFARVPFKATIEYRRKRSDTGFFDKGTVIDLSGDGVFISAENIFTAGELLDTRINLMPAPGTLEIDAKVVWVADQALQPRDYPGMGLEFYNISPAVQEKIVRFIEKYATNSKTK